MKTLMWVAALMGASGCNSSSPSTSSATPGQSCGRVDPADLRQVVDMLSVTLLPRHHLNTDNLDRAANYIRDRWRAAGLKSSEQIYQVNGRTYRNVYTRVGPGDGPKVIIGAHYDAFSTLPAADDNASGVAGLVGLGFALARAQLPVGVELVAYSLEEPPHFNSDNMGSQVHAYGQDPASVLFMISLEMIGYWSDAPGSQTYPLPLLDTVYGTVGNFALVVGRAREGRYVEHVRAAIEGKGRVPAYALATPDYVEPIGLSDHISYWRIGARAMMITDTAEFRNKAYHTVRDTADRLDYQRMASLVDGVCAAMLDVDRVPRPAP